MSYPASYWIETLQMTAHMEGGAFAEIYRSDLQHQKSHLPERFKGPRASSTAIYFLLQKDQFSAFHRIESDELWHFYAGDPLEIIEIRPSGELITHILGNDPEKGASFVHVIPAGSWFASRVLAGGQYGLAGCTVSPGFDFDDFELAKEENLLRLYPQHEKLIRELCR